MKLMLNQARFDRNLFRSHRSPFRLLVLVRHQVGRGHWKGLERLIRMRPAPVIVFRRTDASRSYEVFVNGSKAGSWRGEELEKGISLPFAQEQSPPSRTYTTGFEDDPKPPPELVEWFTPPEKYRADFGGFRSPLLFADGTPVRTAADWQRRRAEILATWHQLMGPWPPLLERPRVEVVHTSRRENITQQELRIEIALGGEMVEGLLLVPEGEGALQPRQAAP